MISKEMFAKTYQGYVSVYTVRSQFLLFVRKENGPETFLYGNISGKQDYRTCPFNNIETFMRQEKTDMEGKYLTPSEDGIIFLPSFLF